MGKYIRVKLPLKSPAATLKLCKETLAKHSALGAGSPLNGFVDMAAFATLVASAESLQNTGDKRQADAKSMFGQARQIACLGRGQTKTEPDTVMWFVMQIRNVLLIKYSGEEKELGMFGYHVVISATGARKNVRVKLPRNKPADLVDLAKEILQRHTDMGASSPLNGIVDVARFSALVTSADDLLTKWKKADEQAQSYHGQALAKLGYAEGQTTQTVGTIYYNLVAIRNRLLQFYEGQEDVMQEYGFHVVVHAKKSGRKRKVMVA